MPAWTLALVLLFALTTAGLAAAWGAVVERAEASRVPVRVRARRDAHREYRPHH